MLAVWTHRPWLRSVSDHARSDPRLGGLLIANDVEGVDVDEADVVLVDATRPGVTPDEVARLREASVAVVVFADPDGLQSADGLAADVTLPWDAEGETTAAVIRRVTGGVVQSGRDERDPESGTLLAVTGKTSTELALGLAAGLGRRRRTKVALIDADTYRPRLAQRLDTRAWATAVDLLSVDGLLRMGETSPEFTACRFGFDLVAGLADPDRWAEVSALGVVRVLAAARRSYDVVVTRVEDRIEPGERFAPNRRVLALADEIVVGMAPTPIGAAEVVRWAATLRDMTDSPLHLVVARWVGTRSEAKTLAAEVARNVALASVTVVPSDRRTVRAVWNATLPRGPAAAAVDRLAWDLRRRL